MFAEKNKPFLPVKEMPEAFRKQIHVVNSEFKFAYGMRLDSTMRDIRNYSEQQIKNFILRETQYEKIFRCPFWMAMDSARYCPMIPFLINLLTDTTVVGLTEASDVTIWCRVKSGQMTHTSANYQIDDDLFRVCGRAHWILKRLTKNEFGVIRCDIDMDDVYEIQKQWQKWLSTLKEK